tara:strand:- start:260 stop:1486 length:1227 start_codon:yes stop_codon:yes gene_type:complete
MIDARLHLTSEDNMVLNRLRDHGEAWIVGGWVRDILQMKNTKSDLDIATTLLPREVMKIFPRTLAIGEEFGTVLVRLDEPSNKQWEVTTLRMDGSYGDGRRPDNVSFGNDISHDLARRDFTINAMAIDVSGELIDIFGGESDLQKNIVRAVGNADERIAEDGLRILRAFRFLDMEKNYLRTLDLQLEKAIVDNLDMLNKVSKERITEEIRKIFSSNNPYKIFIKMKELGVLDILIGDLSIEIEDLGITDPMVILARLLKKNNCDGIELCNILSRSLKLTKKEIKQISFLHNNRNTIFDNSEKSIRKFQVLLSDEQKEWILQYHKQKEIDDKYGNFKGKINMNPILDGWKIAEITGIKPGRKLGLLKDWLFRIQIERNIRSEDEMIDVLNHHIKWHDSDFELWPKLSWP